MPGWLTAALGLLSNGAKALAAYLGLVHDAKVEESGITKQLAADQAAVIKGDADARKIEARIGADDDAAQLAELHSQRDAITRR